MYKLKDTYQELSDNLSVALTQVVNLLYAPANIIQQLFYEF